MVNYDVKKYEKEAIIEEALKALVRKVLIEESRLTKIYTRLFKQKL